MSVEQDYESRFHVPDDAVCNVCGTLWKHNPGMAFLFWRGAHDIGICGACAAEIETGFTADLIQLSALHRIRKLPRQYCELNRHPRGTTRARHAREEREGWAAIAANCCEQDD